MTLDEELHKLHEATLDRLQLVRRGHMEGASDLVAAIPATDDPRKGPLDESIRNSLATHLVAEANRVIEEKKAEGRAPVGLAGSKLEYVGGSYRLTLTVLTAEV
jgi:hypothetical protein